MDTPNLTDTEHEMIMTAVRLARSYQIESISELKRRLTQCYPESSQESIDRVFVALANTLGRSYWEMRL